MVCNKHNTPGIIKYLFWQRTMQNSRAVYACVNYEEAKYPREIEKWSIYIDGDIDSVEENKNILTIIDVLRIITHR